jgi:hypothetical protein
MKRIYNIIGIALMGCLVLSCSNGQKKNKGFNPEERTSSLSIEERDQRLAQKRAELGFDLDSLVASHGVKLSIVMPKVQGDITEEISEKMAIKMLQMASQNGMSGLGTNPNFVLGAEISQTGRAATGTAPQKMTVQYELTFKVMNALNGDVFGTSMQEVQGVGASFEEANLNAIKEIKNTPQIQKFLQAANDRILKWYNENLQVIKNQVQKAEAEGNYELALALLNSIPEQSTSYKYVAEKQDALLKGMLHKRAADMLAEMESVLASSGDDFNPAVGAYFSLIPTDCPEHATAQKMYAEYEKKCKERRATLEAKAERDEAAARELQKLQMLYDHEEALAQKEVDKATAQYQAQAAAKQKSKGFWGGLGDRILGGIDFLTSKFTD